MICRSCRTGLLSRLQPQHTVAWSASSPARQFPLQRSQFRNYSDAKPTVSATPPPPTPRQPGAGDFSTPAAVSSATPGVSQPLSTPEEAIPKPQTPKKPVERPASSCQAGTKMQGLNYFKNKPDVFAREDSEYPEWLWGILDEMNKSSSSEKGGVDPNTLNKKQRKRYEKKMAARAATLPPKIPVHHHATDITPAQYNSSGEAADRLTSATEGVEKRSEITKSARENRRKAIREANFLRGL